MSFEPLTSAITVQHSNAPTKWSAPYKPLACYSAAPVSSRASVWLRPKNYLRFFFSDLLFSPFFYVLGKRSNRLTCQPCVRTSSSTTVEETICGFWDKKWKFSKCNNYFKFYFMLFCLKVLSEKTFHKVPKVFFVLNIWKTLKTEMFSKGSHFIIVISRFFVWIFRLTNTRVSSKWVLRKCNCCSFSLQITC